MTTDAQLPPTDDEIHAVVQACRERGLREFDVFRAVLAKWGTPQPVNLGFTIENRAGIDVLVWKDGGCQPATSAEVAMWKALAAVQQPVVREPLTPDQVTAAAKKLAECMDYPWDYMSYPGQAEMRKHAQAVVEAAHSITQKGGSNAE